MKNTAPTDPTNASPDPTKAHSARGASRLRPVPAGSPSPLLPTASAVGHAHSGAKASGGAPRTEAVSLAWFDSETGERLTVALKVTPSLLRRLLDEGFVLESGASRTAG